MSCCNRTRIGCAVCGGVSSLNHRIALGQHLLLFLSISVAIWALLVNRWGHGAVALSLCVAGAGYGWRGVGGAALWVKRTVACAAVRFSHVGVFASIAGSIVSIKLI